MGFKFKRARLSKDSDADDSVRPGAYERIREAFGPKGPEIEDSEELQRILALPRRPPIDLDTVEARVVVQRQTEKFARDRTGLGPCECQRLNPEAGCITELLPVQAVTLREITMAQGLWGSVVTGGGKSILDVLAILALEDCERGLLLVPANLIRQIFNQWQLYSEHFRVPKIVVHLPGGQSLSRESLTGERAVLHVMSHNGISSPKQSIFIERIKPDVIIVDEVDGFSALDSARTIRLLRFMREHPDTKFCCWTGSPSDQSIQECAHLLAFALKKRSPMPLSTQIVDDWGRCINAVSNPCPPGALMQFVGAEDDGDDDVDVVRAAFRRRLEETLGVIMTASADVHIEGGEELVKVQVLDREAPPLPEIIQQALTLVRSGERPDTLVGNEYNEVFSDPKEQVRCAREVSCGMFYRWVFPNRERREVIDRWFKVRRAWNSEVRELILRGQRFLDSPKLCEDAAKRHYKEIAPDANLPVWAAVNWKEWREVRDTVKPKTAACRLHPYLVEDAVEWAQENKGIVWYSTVELAEWMHELSGLPVYGGGPDAEANIERLIRSPKAIGSVLASMNSHGRGRDGLQNRYSDQLILNVPSSSKRNQQLYARLHRRGQKSDTVRSWIYVHTPELKAAHLQAIQRSDYVEAVSGQRQKLKMGLASGARDALLRAVA